MGIASGARAAEQPLWEFGLGVGAIVFNDYRGASDLRVYPVPVPYFLYRGDILRADRDGAHARFFDERFVTFDISVNATAPVFSSNSGARAGMPDLKSTIEVGPSLQWHLWRASDDWLRLDLRTPFREAFTIAAPPQAIGALAAPQLAADFRPRSGLATGWNLGLLAGPLYAQRRYHEYFYAVAPQYATPSRPVYEPAGGYSGTQLLGSLSRRYKDYWVGAYLRHDWLQGAAFQSSPLVQQRSYWSGGFGFVWMISASSRTVDSNE